MKLGKLALLTAMCISLLFVTSGCWNSRELNRLAIVTAMSIDKAENSNKYELSFQVVMPGELSSSSKGGGNAPFNIYSVQSETLFEGIRKASKQVPRQLFFSHIQVVVLGERLAKAGIEEIFDFFERSHEVRLTSMLLVARGSSPTKLISAIVPLAPLQSEALVGASEFSAKIWSGSPVIGLDDAIRKLINPGSEPSISGLRIYGNEQNVTKKQNVEQTRPPYHLEISGIAVFRGGKLAGWLDNGQARGYMFIVNHMRSTIMNLDCQDKPNGLALEIIKSKTKTDVSMKNGRAKVNIVVSAEGNVAEVKCGIPLDKLDVLTKLEQEWGYEAKANMMAAIQGAQKLQSDVFCFGEVLQRKHPKQWKQVQDRWDETFADAEVSIDFRGQILRSGMRGKSLMQKDG
ncbi:Ger(x)C family spore germination protein [Paenibacillus montanisoli]|uniref:Ger(X)C family spore germination protein n=1 Tax=Paenibacillus montanisoli TaxID=2081970 RepID=A0A328TXS9_9BACL|nr:Ger(x)C family spore germination protein [Paenibacillus montanisoli]RAP75250.1 Ger(x)C family spore germination protein [Paenibacillus montanisoli]